MFQSREYQTPSRMLLGFLRVVQRGEDLFALIPRVNL